MSSESMQELYGYVEQKIDADKGIIMKGLGGGRYVVMYFAMPGLYLDKKGCVVPDDLAKQAGFDVKADREEAMLNEELKAAEEEIRARRADRETEIRERVTPASMGETPFQIPDEEAPLPEVDPRDYALITERNQRGEAQGTADFEMKHIGAGNWVIIDRETTAEVSETIRSRKAATAKAVALQKAKNEAG